MKRQITILLTVFALCVVFEGLSLTSANAERQRNQPAGASQSLLPGWLLRAFTSAPIPKPTVGPEDEDLGEVLDNDPDVRPGTRINKEKYLKLRNEYFAMLRGYEPDRPFDSMARGRAIRAMEGQERDQAKSAAKGSS